MASTDPIIVLDNGSDTCKARYGGDGIPQVVVRTIHAEEKVRNITELSKNKYVGDTALNNPMLNIHHPIKRGIIENSDEMEKISEFILHNQLKIEQKKYPVIVCEPPENWKITREKMVEVFFEKFDVPHICLRNQTALVLETKNVDTGIVLICEHEVTYTVPVASGCAMTHAIGHLDFAGKDLTDYFIKLLNKRGYSFESTTERENARVMKELSCSIGLKINKTEAPQSKSSRGKYNFPSYSIGDEADKCSEILFDPKDIGRNRGIYQILIDSIVKCDISIQQELCNNIILDGGTTNIQGFRDRLQEELQALAINQIHIYDGVPEKRQYVPRLGASMLSTSPNLKDFW
ncbi:unnamed protein product [Rotaria magnacalcarata]|uniref:Actin n=1 Tax=Rotaria magnacalcarata TaxID=392030 RepID=A0A819XUQ7_9BILA|nr:unnamed protein product [Rotaria magnacalcarata]CAF2137907.1 unnamed protein product [Rotaria magnacalcarata]CAF4112428.1 unnamed protein product [Rotaria magnacalcarata]CAF4146251.1 unnamed protein product [Rotaria magnacalcarata]